MIKKALLLFAVALLLLPASGQFRIGLQGGLNLATLTAKNYNNDFAHNQFRTGLTAGPVVEFALGDHLSVAAQLTLDSKGTDATYYSDTLHADGSIHLLYLDFPLLVRGKIKAGDFTIFLDAGPYAGFGFSGTGTLETSDKKVTRDIQWGHTGNDEFRRFDFGILGGAGVEWNKFSIEGTFGFGLANIYSVPQIGYIIQHRVFSVRVGYFLGK